MKKSHSNSIGIKILSLALVLVFGVTAFVVGPSMFASEADSIPGEAVNAVKAGGNTAKAAPAAAGSGDKITVRKFEIDTKTIAIGEKPDVTFTAEITGVLGEKDAKVVGGSDTLIGYMNDKGVDGDKVAGDGTYTLKLGMSHDKSEDVFYHADAKGVKSEDVKIGYYSPLTDEECKAMDDSDNRIKECMRSDDFDQMSVSDRKEVMEDLLYQMADDGEIKRDSIKYDEDNKHFTFEYACSVYGGVHITPRDENKNSAGSDINTGDLGINTVGADNDDLKIDEIPSPFAAADKEAKLSSKKSLVGSSNNVFDPKGLSAPAISQNNIQNKEAESTSIGANGTTRALILNGFANRGYRRNFYYSLQTEWNSMGLNTTVDVDVTVDDMKALTSHDVIIFAMHGMVYDGSPVLCINQVPTSTTNSKYSYELRTRHSIARDTFQDTDTDTGSERVVDAYVVFPLLFRDNYSSTAFAGKFVFSESCCFFGEDGNENYALSNALYACGLEPVIGFHNSVYSTYARKMMKLVVELLYQGKSIAYAFSVAKFIFGGADGGSAYPIMDVVDNNYSLRNDVLIRYNDTIPLNTSTTVSFSDDNAKSVRIFKYVPTANMPIEFYSTGNYNTQAILFDSNFEQLTTNDDISSSNQNFKISYNLQANKTYYFMCFFYNWDFEGSFSVMLKGTPPAAKSISNCDISISPTSYIFDNTAKTPTVTVKDGSTTLTKDTHYTVSYSNNVNVGEGKAIITGKGNYTGSVEKKFTIAYDTISLNSSKSVTISTAGTKKFFKFVPTKNMKVEFYSTGSADTRGYLYNASLGGLASNDDMDRSSNRNFKITYELTANTTYIFACDLFSGTGSFTVYLKDVSQKSIKDCTVDISPTSFIFDNTAKTPTVTVKDGSKTLTINTDYTVIYSSNTAVGEGKVSVYGKGDYNDVVSKTFSIVYDTISLNSSKSVTISIAQSKKYFKFVPTKNMKVEYYSTGTVDTVGYIYSPDDLSHPVVMDDDSGENSNFRFTYDLTANTTYLFACAAYASNTGSFTVRLTDSITQKPISNCDISISPTSYIFDNTAKTPTVTVKDGSTTLTKNTHYTVSYSNNVNAGEGKATITGLGSYTGSVEKKFTIAYDTISLNSSKSVTISTSGTKKFFKFVPTKNMKVEFYSTGSKDTVGYLYSSSLAGLATNRDIDATSNKNFKITYELTANTTYIFACKINSGTGSFTVYLKDVTQKSLSECTVSVSSTSYIFDNTAKTPTVTVKDGSTTLTKNTHYTVSYSNNVNVGEGKVTITGLGNYTGSVEKKFTIAYDTISLNSSKILTISTAGAKKFFKFVPTKNMKVEFYSTGSADTKGYLYNASLAGLASNDDMDGNSNRNFKITYELTANTTYLFACKIKSGTGSFTVYLKEASKKSISECTVSVSPTSYIFDNTAKTPTVTVKDGSTTLTKDTHYTVSYSNNVNVGEGKVIITGLGSYTGSVEKKFTIAYDTISLNSSKSVTISTSGTKKFFKFVPTKNMKVEFYSTGSKDTVGYLYSSGLAGLATSHDIDATSNKNFKITYELTANTTYIFACKINSGTGSFTVYLKDVSQKSISECTVSVSPTSYIFDNTAKTPTVTVKDGSTTLTKNTHYTVSYSNNVYAGEGKATITGMGSYTGSVEKKFTIAYDTISLNSSKSVTTPTSGTKKFFKFVPTTNMRVEFFSAGSKDTVGYLYDSSLAGLATSHDIDATSNKNFKITYNLTANTAYIFACKLYSGTGSFTVYLREVPQKSISTCTVSVSPTSYIFDNTAKTPTVTVKDGTNTLVKNTDYTVTYQNNKNAGTAKAVITGIGEYKDSVTKTFTIAYDTISQDSAKTVNITTKGTMKYYKFVPDYDFTMQFYSTGSKNTYGYVYDSNMNVLASNDDSGSGNNFVVSYDVKANTTYVLGCKLNDANATGSFSVYVENTAKKQRLSLSVENKNNGLRVQWSALDGATGYKVFYKTSNTAWSSTIVNDTGFNLQTGTPGYMYYFQVLPIFGSSNGTYSDVVSCTYVCNTTLESTAYNSNGSVTIGWAVAPGANGYAIAKRKSTDTSYTYYYTSSTSFNDKNVVGGALYYYQIRPYYTDGKNATYSDWSNTKTITTLFRPTVTSMNATATNLNINWNSIMGAQGYKIAFKRSYDSAWNYRTTTSCYYNIPNPTRGATYYIQVCATSGNLAGQYSTLNTVKIP